MASKFSASMKKVASKDGQATRVPAAITTSADRVLAVTKQLQGQLAYIVNNPRVQVIAVSAGGTGATLALAGGTVGGSVGGATGAAVGVLPAIFTFGLSIPVGFVVGGTVGASTGVVVGGGTGLVGGGMAGSVAYAYRVQVNDGKVYITAKVKDTFNKAQMKGIQIKRAGGIQMKDIHELACTVSSSLKKSQDAVFGKNGKWPRLRDEVRNVTSQTKFQVTAASAAGGATVGGAGGGAVGLTAGAVLGGAIGIVPALFTFGLSIPIGAAIGGGTGLCIGATAGGGAGAVTGGAVGYGAYTKRDMIRAASSGCLIVLVKQWETLDTNKDGKVSKDEFLAGCKTLYGAGKDLSKEELEKLYEIIMSVRAQLDRNKDGKVSNEELLTGLKAMLGRLGGNVIVTTTEMQAALREMKFRGNTGGTYA